MPEMELSAEPQLSLFAFRHRPAGMADDEALDAHNRRFLARINDRQRVLLTGARIPVAGRLAFVLRICVLSFRTHRDRIDAAIEDVAAALESPAS